MRKKELVPLTSYDQEPEGMTEEEAREFWDTHAITEEYLASAPPVSEDDFPSIRPPRKWRSFHVRSEVFDKLRRLARQRGIQVNDLIDSLATQALAAEEAAEEASLKATAT
jgi:hypothetical protein